MRRFKAIPVILALLTVSCGRSDNGTVTTGTAESQPPVESVETYVDPEAPEDGGISIESSTAGEILDYFAEVAFGSEYGTASERLCRWKNEIRYTVSGDPTDSDLELIGILVDTLNGIEGFPGMKPASGGDGNFEIMFIPRSEIIEEFEDASEACAGMSEYHWYTESCEIFRARAAIDSEEAEERESTVCEEILQALGLAMDSYSHMDSVFYQGKCVYKRPSELDWTLIRVLYHGDLAAGMSKYEAITAAAGILAW